MQKIVGAGCILNHEDKRPNHKIIFNWCLYSQQRILKLLKQLIPFLIVKKQKAIEVIDYIEKNFIMYKTSKGVPL